MIEINRTYDGLGRLVTEAGSGPIGVGAATKRFDYDLQGRTVKLSHPGGDITLSWDDRDQLRATSGGAGTSTLEYDPDGRLTRRSDDAGTA